MPPGSRFPAVHPMREPAPNAALSLEPHTWRPLSEGGIEDAILLIEDDRMIGAAIEQALKDAAYAVDWVAEGEAAICAAESETYELILLDLGLPETDGRDVLRRLRRRGRRLPVIIVTARYSVEDRIGGLDLGADDYLVKPFEIRELLARMRAGCGARAAARHRCSATASSVSIPQPGRRHSTTRARCSARASSLCCERCWRGRARSCREAISNDRSTAGTKRSRATQSSS